MVTGIRKFREHSRRTRANTRSSAVPLAICCSTRRASISGRPGYRHGALRRGGRRSLWDGRSERSSMQADIRPVNGATGSGSSTASTVRPTRASLHDRALCTTTRKPRPARRRETCAHTCGRGHSQSFSNPAGRELLRGAPGSKTADRRHYDHRRDSAHTVQGRACLDLTARLEAAETSTARTSGSIATMSSGWRNPAPGRIRRPVGARPPGPPNLCRQDAGRRNAGSQGVRRAVQPKRGGPIFSAGCMG